MVDDKEWDKLEKLRKKHGIQRDKIKEVEYLQRRENKHIERIELLKNKPAWNPINLRWYDKTKNIIKKDIVNFDIFPEQREVFNKLNLGSLL